MQRFSSALVARRELGPDVVELSLAPEGGARAFVPGQHVRVVVADDRDDATSACFYSLAQPPAPSGELVICVKRDGGVCSGHLLARAVGERLEMVGPAGELVLVREPGDEGRDCLLVATGTGITPFHAMREQLRERTAAGAGVTLLYGARDLGGLLYDDTWRELDEQLAGFSYIPTLSRGEAPGCLRGRVTLHLDRALATLARPRQALVLLCGVAEMIADARAALAAHGFDAARLRTEY